MVDVILAAASRVLIKRGLAGYNTTAVAEQAGVSIGSVYQYFPNRDALTAALILQMHVELVDMLRKKLVETEGMPPERAFFTLIDASLPKDTAAKKLARVLEFEEERLPRTAKLMNAESEIQALNVSFLRRYVRSPKVGPKDIELAAFDMISIIRGMIDATLTRTDALDGLSERITRAVLGYLTPLLGK